MKSRRILVCALTAALLPALACAEHTHYWRESDSTDFSRGTAKGVAIRSDGKLMPAPEFTQFSDPNLAYIWQLRLDSQGRLYAAGGPNAKVVRFDAAGKSTTVFESSELAAQAIAFDSHDNLYVGTSPDGKVYKVTPDGQKSIFFTPKTKYIWSLQMDHDGDLFVGTGDQGKVYAVRPDGSGGVFYQTDQRHARSLALDGKGDLLIGTDPDGLVIRVHIERKSAQAAPTAGQSFVLYETDKKEVTSLAMDSSGNLYAASIGEKGRPSGPMMPPQVSAEQPQAVVTASGEPGGIVVTSEGQQHEQERALAPLTYFASAAGGSELVRLSPDGSPKQLWASNADLIFATAFSPAGKVLLGTGDSGSIIQLEGNGVYSTVAQSASAQVTSLLAAPGGKMFVATANPGKIFTLGPGYAKEGTFESNTFDADIFSHWGRLTWWGENGATDGKVAFYARSGNTSSPEKNWSAWAGPYKNPADGAPVNCPPARFAQWKAVFLDTAGSPDISWVSLAYQPKNVAPVVQDIAIQDPGVRLQEFPQAQVGPGGRMNVQLRMPQSDGTISPSPANAEEYPKQSRVEIPPQGFWEKGWQSVIWSAHDENGDDLVFSIYYRGEGEKNWRLLKNHVIQHYYSWDTTTMPDGAYYLKIVASDSPSNPADQALTAERYSDRFEVENTPPTIEALTAQAHSPEVTVTFRGISAGSSALARAKYSVDGGPWQIVYPVGLLSDAPKQEYQFELDHLAAGEHTIAVQIADRFDNTAAAKATFTVPAGADEK
ncbi:MAG TPA: Ig-like domain-containing protein [Candidatus Acidoferrum sp.]|nr:Ig-like domain-containing protein [Candidatus Acidoferrum sp.]